MKSIGTHPVDKILFAAVFKTISESTKKERERERKITFLFWFNYFKLPGDKVVEEEGGSCRI